MGWRFLRNETVLLANTIQASIAQFTVGIMTVLTVIYCYEVFRDHPLGYSGVWGFLEAGTGAGNLVGGFVIGLFGSRVAKGRMIIAGYAALGLLTFLLAITDHVGIAIGLAFGSGVANMVFLIPSQALFQERTPSALLGRVVGFRFALVFGSMTVAMGVGSLMIIAVPATTVIALFGLVTLVDRARRLVRPGDPRRVGAIDRPSAGIGRWADPWVHWRPRADRRIDGRARSDTTG